MPKGKKKNHPCAQWCEGQLHGIVENLKLRREIDQDFQVEFVALIGFKLIPPGTYCLKCVHGREWMIREPRPARV